MIAPTNIVSTRYIQSLCGKATQPCKMDVSRHPSSTPVIEDLRGLLKAYRHSEGGYLFPGRWGKGHINSDSAARILREAFERVGIEGGSTHSFRRTGLTQLSNAGIPLRVIQEISGHTNLEQLQKYLEVKPEQVRGAVAALSMLSHEGGSIDGEYVGKYSLYDSTQAASQERPYRNYPAH